ncbi:MAG TPA: DUF6755 family protein [Candidatus Polarisedimenticolaceae bacterium]|nr:DUF6755 family protein [Candidatus Polarisedimenticolaceae bacterium]
MSRFARSQRSTIVNGILCLIAIIVVLQLWLFTATMEAFLGGDEVIAVPAALVSTLCFVLGLGLRRYLRTLDP